VSHLAAPDTQLLLNTGSDATLLGIAAVAAVLWVGSFIFLSLPEMKSRYPVAVASGLSFLQSVFIFTLLAVVAPSVVLRVVAALWALYYLFVGLIQRFADTFWKRLNKKYNIKFNFTPLDGDTRTESDVPELPKIFADLIDRATGWSKAAQLFLAFLIIAIWPTAQCVSLVSVYLIWQGSRLVRAALLDHLHIKPTPSTQATPTVDIEALLKRLHLSWLLRFKYVREQIAQYKERKTSAAATNPRQLPPGSSA
jgi:hypothetical protein